MFNLSHGDALVLDLQAAMLGEEAEQTSFWRGWTGYSEPQSLESIRQKKVIDVPKGMIVKMIRSSEAGAYTGQGGKEKGGGDHYRMYDKKPILGQGVSNDIKVLGTGKTRTLNGWDLYINRKRHETLVHIGEMNNIREGAWALAAVKDAGPDLIKWAQKWEAWYSYAETLFFKYSKHITDPVVDGGYAVTKEYHPNMMFLGLDQGTGYNKEFATWSSTAATYAARCARNLVNVVPDNARCVMTAAGIRRAEKNARARRMAPLNLPGGVNYLFVLHPDSLEDLQSDEEFARLLQNWNSGALDQSKFYFTNDTAKFSNTLICSEWNGPCEVYPRENSANFLAEGNGLNNIEVIADDSKATEIMFGPIEELVSVDAEVGVKDMLDPRDNTYTDRVDFAGAALDGVGVESNLLTKRCNLFLGEYALCGMEVQENKFYREETDYGNRKGMDIDFIRALARPDKKDDDTSPTYADNTTSMLVMSAFSGQVGQ